MTGKQNGTYLVETAIFMKIRANYGKKSSKFTKKNYFYISQMKSSLNKIFYKVVYHHIIYMCGFFGEFRRPFDDFSRRLWFPPDMFPIFLPVLLRRTDSMLVVLIRPCYQVYTFGNSTIKLCIETGLILQI